jgi:hypothetical protein
VALATNLRDGSIVEVADVAAGKDGTDLADLVDASEILFRRF